jgi:hypothetical protein
MDKLIQKTILLALAVAQTTPTLSYYDKVATQFDGVTSDETVSYLKLGDK